MNNTKIDWLAFILEDRAFSMGRAMAWCLFVLMIVLWLTVGAVPESLLNSFYVLMTYNMGKKITQPIENIMKVALEKKHSDTSKALGEAVGLPQFNQNNQDPPV